MRWLQRAPFSNRRPGRAARAEACRARPEPVSARSVSQPPPLLEAAGEAAPVAAGLLSARHKRPVRVQPRA